MKVIELTTNGKSTIVDDEDYEILSKYKWHLGAYGYAARYEKEVGKKDYKVFLHRELFGLNRSHSILVDHIDHNRLNNQKSNLRLATKSQDAMNKRKAKGKSSKYKGVCWDKKNKLWLSGIVINSKRIHLGRYKEEREAALAYNKKARELFGEFACLNKVLA